MKKSLMILLFLITTTAFASLDAIVGKYELKGGHEYAYAEVKKELVAQPTLFEPAKYEYKITLDGTRDGLYLDEKELKITDDGKSFYLDTDNECDDPDCPYYETIEVKVKMSRRGNPYITVYYYGATISVEYPSEEFEGTEVYFKKK